MELASQIASAVIALGLSLLVYVRQVRANANADVSAWFETHEGNTFMVIKNHGPGVAREINGEFFDAEGQRWVPRRDVAGTQFPLFPIEVLAAGEWIERAYLGRSTSQSGLIAAKRPVPATFQQHAPVNSGQRRHTWAPLRCRSAAVSRR